MDYENERTVQAGCWDGWKLVTAPIEETTSKKPTPTFSPSDQYCNFLIDVGFGKDTDQETRKFWTNLIKKNYQSDAGRKRMREASVNLRERDGLHGRLINVKCPVLWLQGDKDVVYSVENAKEEIKMFENSPDARLVVVKDGHHFLSWTNQTEVDNAVLEFVVKYHKGEKPDARALREAVGMVEM